MRRMAALAGIVVALLVLAAPGTAQASFPGANGKFAFTSCGAHDCGIFVMEPDGSARTQITHNANWLSAQDRYGTDRAPAWSPRGDRIAFEREVPEGNPEIYVVDADGSNLRGTAVSGNDPAWSPDGTKIAFWPFGGPLGSNGIYVMNEDGSGLTRVHQGDDPRDTDWSPDGTRIAYAGIGPRFQDREIRVVPASGGTPTSLTPSDSSPGAPRVTNFGPSWSPDATRIAFSASVPGQQWDLFAIGADGTNRTRLTFTDEDQSPILSEERASWSPDGTRIAYVRDSPFTAAEIVVITVDGAQETVVGPGSGTAWQPIPNRPPDCAGVSASPSALHPPNHKLTKVATTGATDPDGDAVEIEITGVTQDERVGRRPDARAGTAANEVLLRAQRRPKRDGRVYRIPFTASDGKGAECSGTATVEVRRHKKRPAVDSAPPSYDSFTPSTTP